MISARAAIPPVCFDDASFHADDRLVPGAVAISTGDSVTFNIAGFHRVAIYEPGTKPKDIDVSILDMSGLLIEDPEERFALGLSSFAEPMMRLETFTFDEPASTS